MAQTIPETNSSVYDPDKEKPVTAPGLSGDKEVPETPAELLDRIPTMSDEEAAAHYADSPGGKDSELDPAAEKLSKDDLSNAENASKTSHPNTVGNGFKKTGNPEKKRFTVRGLTRKQTLFGGGAAGIVIAALMFFTFLSGPLEFIHIAQLLEKAHFSHQQNAGDSRLGKMYRWFRSGDVGETRLTFLESKYKNKILGDMKKVGLEPQYNSKTGYLESFQIDASNPESPYHGMSSDEVKATLEGKYGSKVSVDQFSGLEGGKFKIKVAGFFGAPRTNALLVNEAGTGKLGTVIRGRVMSKYGYANWHPLKILDRKLNAKVADTYSKWREGRQAELSGKTTDNTITTKGGVDGETPDPNNPKGTPLPDGTTVATPENTSGILKSISASKSLKVTGGLAAAAGIVCAAKSVNDNIGTIRFVQVISPLIRMSMEAITVGSQIMSGQQVDQTELSFLSKNFDGPDSSNPDAPKQITNWSEAKTFQAQEGNTGGVDIDQGTKDLITQGSPGWLSWTNNSEVGALCSTTGSIITGAISIGLGVISGGTISTVGGLVSSALAGPIIMDKLSHLIAGAGVDVLAQGAQYGNYLNYGARLSGNTIGLMFGGVPLSTAQEASLNNAENTRDIADFHTHGIAYRIFNPYDQRSAISKVIDKTSPDITQNFASIGNYLLTFNRSLASLPHMFTGRVNAATSVPYDYGFPEFGFSQEDLNNPLVDNPYTNADAVAGILNGADGAAYISKAQDCFGVDIANGEDGWDVLPDDGSQGPNNPDTNPYSDKYPKDCVAPAGLDKDNWLRVRFFIMDTAEMEGYACYQGDDQSCANDGFDDGSSSVAAQPTDSSAGTNGISINNQAAQQVVAAAGSDVKIGYSLTSSDGKVLAESDPTTVNYGASITKSMLLVAYLRQVGTGKVSSQASGELTKMIENSDNDAANWVYSHLDNGPPQVKAVANDAGMTGFALDTSDPTYKLGQSKITAQDFAKFFSKIDTLIPKDQRDFGLSLLSNLSASDQNGLLKANLPGPVYSKEGWKPEPAGLAGAPYIVNQAGQFSVNGVTYGIAVTVGGTANRSSGEVLIQKLVTALVATQ